MSNEAAEGSLAEVAYRGEWRIEPGKSPETVNLSLSYPASASNSSGSITCSDLDLTIASLAGKPFPVHFALRREAGTFECRGTVGEGRGRGAFRFRPDLAYERALAESGLPPLTHRAHVQAGLFDVRSSYVATIAEIMLPSVTFDRMLKAKTFRAYVSRTCRLYAHPASIRGSSNVSLRAVVAVYRSTRYSAFTLRIRTTVRR